MQEFGMHTSISAWYKCRCCRCHAYCAEMLDCDRYGGTKCVWPPPERAVAAPHLSHSGRHQAWHAWRSDDTADFLDRQRSYYQESSILLLIIHPLPPGFCGSLCLCRASKPASAKLCLVIAMRIFGISVPLTSYPRSCSTLHFP
ncbi:hypothetical protein IQ07DRAFT_19557 [Pyrenochaeta sp. DS3sAY3a]|nr:hypothetical protein IQ07DRAFT_19557 [Pyrenochaeta sp. DS3sAY3a]